MVDGWRNVPEITTLMTAVRREVHGEPEVGLNLPLTQQKVLAALSDLPLEISTGKALSSVTAVLRGTSPEAQRQHSKVVLIRADMDALPVTETTGLPYRSRFPGFMHACGHDLHTAMLVGAAHLLSGRREALSGDVVFMFQPGEEGYDGARLMVEEGVLDAAGRPPIAALALHVFTGIGTRGTFFTRAGTMLASSDQIHVTVTGRGGHASKPYLARDPITAAAAMVTAIQTLVTRRFDVFDPIIVSVGTFHSGTRANVVPPDARFEATVRTFSPGARDKFQELIPPLLQGISAAHAVDVQVDWVPGYPMTINSDVEFGFIAERIETFFGGDRLEVAAHPLPGAEDFSRVLSRVPGTFVGLSAGAGGESGDDPIFNHSPDAEFDDSLLLDGAMLQAEWALHRLGVTYPP